MLRALVLLIMFQFVGEALARLAGLPVPGPVIGLALIVAAMLARPALFGVVKDTADGLLRHLSLLFVPAGVGVLQHLGLLQREILPILGVLVLSTLITLVVTAVTFSALARGSDAGVDEDRAP